MGEVIYQMLKKYDYDAAAKVLFLKGVEKLQERGSSLDAARLFNRALDCVVCDDCFFECLVDGQEKILVKCLGNTNEEALFVEAIINLYSGVYDNSISAGDKYIQLYGETANILYVKARASVLSCDYETADQLHDEILEKFDNGTNLKVLYRGAILNEEYCKIDGLSILVQLVELAPHTLKIHTVIRELMQKRNLSLNVSEETDNCIYAGFNNPDLDNGAFMEILMSHYTENNDTYKEYLDILSKQIFS